MASSAACTGALRASGNRRFVELHGGLELRRILTPDEGEHAHSSWSGELRQRQVEELQEAEETAARYRAAAAGPSKLAQAFLRDLDEGEQSVAGWLRERFDALGIRLPSLEVAYKDLSVETDAAVGAAGIPTVASWLGGQRLAAALGRSSGRHTLRLPILRGVKGVLRPGRLTLLLGPPGAGKSVLLQALAGQLAHSKSLRVAGDILYNGQRGHEFDLQRTASYVEQYDCHLPLLTVRETLAFARACLWESGTKNDFREEFGRVLEAEAARVGRDVLPQATQAELQRLLASPEFMVELTLRLLGLKACADTVVGDAMIRGISGGQKRRLTCGELLVGGRELLLLDEISTGLDSATTFTVVKWLGELARPLAATLAVSLLQPSGEVLGLFDDVLLLAEGRVLYHGPVPEVQGFFVSLGFDCPPRKDMPSFLQDVTSAMGQRALAGPALLARKPQPGSPLLLPLEEVEAAFWGAASGPGAAMRAAVEAPHTPGQYADVPKTLVHASDVGPWAAFFCLCVRRQFKLLGRDTELLQGRLVQVVLVGVIVGTLFLQLAPTIANGSKFLGVGFMSVAMLAFLSLPLTGSVFALKPTFLKQRALHFFPPSAYGAALVVQELPITLACAVLFSVLVYFLAGFTYAAAPFFMFTLLLLLAGLVFGLLFVVLAALTPTLQVAGGLSGVLILALILLSGFSIVRQSIPGWWIWLFWANPMSWLTRSVSTNEMLQPRWDYALPVEPGSPYSGMRAGDVVLATVGMYPHYRWVWAGVGFLVGCYLLGVAAACAAFWATSAPTKVATVAEPPGEAPQADAAAAAEAGAAVPAGAAAASEDELTAPPADGSGAGDAKLCAGRLEGGSGKAGAEEHSAALDIPFTPMTLLFKDISYFVKKPSWSKLSESKAHPGMIQLLNNVSGVVRPGHLCCLMGASGAGKTTLLDVVAGRKTTGLIQGEIKLNGHPKQDGVWRRVSAYVEQAGIHTETATVREALLFSARLRLPASVGSEEIARYVEGVLELVEMGGLRDALVGAAQGGGVGGAGLSLEQRKRLSIAVELVANPAVIFMDEPTSGLGGHAAAVVMRVTRSMANAQRAIVCTIHQPSAEIFFAFDQLVLLQTGGHLMYRGPVGFEGADLIAYFSAGGVRAILPGENPASWMLDVAGGSAAGESKGPDFVQWYQSSELRASNQQAIEEASQPSGDAPAVGGGTYAATLGVQLAELLRRQATRYWRLPEYNAIRLLVTLAFALVVGTLYWNKGQVPREGATSTDVTNIMGMLFMTLSSLGQVNMGSIVIVAAQERTVLYRERAAGMYSALMYVNAAALVELPWLLLQVFLFSPVAYFMIGFHGTAGHFFFFLLVLYLALLVYTFFGQMCLYITPNVQAAQALAAVLAGMFDIFNGFFLPKGEMPGQWRWAWYINPVSYMAYAIAADQLGTDETLISTAASPEPLPVKDFLANTYGFHHSFLWYCILILAGFILLFRAISTAAVRFLNWQSR
ncbi:hypothetical protein ABPG75_005845 [Micractinium tetrahymenae]